MVSKLAILPQTGNTDSEIVIQSVGGIRCVDSVFLTFDDGKANAMTQGKQLQCSKFFFSKPFLPDSCFLWSRKTCCRRKKLRGHISRLLSDPKRSANPELQVSIANVQKLAEYLTDFARGNSS